MEEHELEIAGITGDKDSIGLTSIVVPYKADTLEEVSTVAMGRKVLGMPERSRSFAQIEGGMYRVDVLYQGQDTPTVDPGEAVQISVKGSFSEEPIELHPKLLEILEKYNGSIVNGRAIFPETYDKKATSGVALQKKESSKEKNPFFGVEKYKKLGVGFTRTYVASELPGNLLARVGRVVSSPPNAPSTAALGRRKWLVMPPSANGRGNVVEVTEEYELLDEEVPDELYKNAD